MYACSWARENAHSVSLASPSNLFARLHLTNITFAILLLSIAVTTMLVRVHALSDTYPSLSMPWFSVIWK